ncbi:VTT domain-containing protein [Pedobacter antarcticus]|uniref:Membrane protein n=2 Tax=Pedobacter antarcticus TaxID=34086 RepID=A0A081PFF7_9SPHI|nr:VTT domain-containing protein [Pedobacter antarcticus]KEQ29430.1 membrane protein [Pedobacter antarcticus 4BY]SDM68142.1 membrane-associated protein [Pedobacter antarcticus]SFF39785.1 membrane-associated protein [Pedobacter antarcticus]
MDIINQLIQFILHTDVELVKLVSNYQTWTYLILFIIIFAETGFVVTPFLPGDSMLFAVGALIAKGNTGLDIWIMFFLLTAAGILGNSLNYRLGSFFGVKVFKPQNRILKLEYYNKSHEFFEKHGGKAIIFSRFLPIFRTIAPFVAGVAKMPFGRFTYYNIVGGIAWIASLLFAGYLLGQIPLIRDNFSLVIAFIAIVTFAPVVFAALKSMFKPKETID